MSHSLAFSNTGERLREKFGALVSAPRKMPIYTAISWVLTLILVSPLIARVGPHTAVVYHLDLDVYREGTKAFLHKQPVYQGPFAVRGINLLFIYPPFAALLFAPSAWMPLKQACLLISLASVVLLWWLASVIVRALILDLGLRQAMSVGSWIMPVLVLLSPVRETMHYGQIYTILLALVVTDLLLPKNRRWQWSSGILTGITAAVKLTPLVFGLLFVIRRQWRVAITTGATFVVCVILAFIFDPTNSKIYWTSALAKTSSLVDVGYSSNQSFQGFLTRYAPAGIQKPAWLLCVLVALALTVYGTVRISRVSRRRGGAAQSSVTNAALFSLSCLVGLQVSPISWVHHWVWFIPLALVVVVAAMSVTDIATSRTSFWLAAMAIGVLMLPSNLLLPHENGVEKQFPVWLRSMYEPYVVVGIMFILTACILPQPLLGISRHR